MRKLFTLLFLIAAFSVQAQHSVTLSTGKVVKGKITSITNEMVIIESYGNVYKCPYSQVTSYDNGDGIVIINGNSNNRITSTKVNPSALTAGNELIKASRLYYTGMGIMIGGGIATVVATTVYKPQVGDNDAQVKFRNNMQTTVLIIGSAATLVGFIVQSSAFAHIRLAGDLLNVSTSKDGIGLSLKL